MGFYTLPQKNIDIGQKKKKKRAERTSAEERQWFFNRIVWVAVKLRAPRD